MTARRHDRRRQPCASSSWCWCSSRSASPTLGRPLPSAGCPDQRPRSSTSCRGPSTARSMPTCSTSTRSTQRRQSFPVTTRAVAMRSATSMPGRGRRTDRTRTAIRTRILGKVVDGWPDERWVDIRQLAVLNQSSGIGRPVRQQGLRWRRIRLDRQLRPGHRVPHHARGPARVRPLAGMAGPRPGSLGRLKNSGGLVAALVDRFDFVVTEEASSTRVLALPTLPRGRQGPFRRQYRLTRDRSAAPHAARASAPAGSTCHLGRGAAPADGQPRASGTAGHDPGRPLACPSLPWPRSTAPHAHTHPTPLR